MIRLNIFKNGTYPQKGKVLLWDQGNGDQKQLFTDIESLFDNEITVSKLFTEKGGEISQNNQLFHDDLLIFTTQKREIFQPPQLHSFGVSAAVPREFPVNVRWLSQSSNRLENVALEMKSNCDTVLQLKSEMLQKASDHFNSSELSVIYKGVELVDSCHLYPLYQQFVAEQRKANDSDQELTLFCVCKPFTIRVLTPSNRKIVLTLERSEAPNTSIEKLKELIFEQENTESCQKMKLYSQSNKLLSDDDTVGGCGLFTQTDRLLRLKYSVF